MHFILYNRPPRVPEQAQSLVMSFRDSSTADDHTGKICTLSSRMTKLLQPLFQTQLNNKQTSPAQFGQVKSGSNMSTNNGQQTISGNVENALHEIGLTRGGPRKTLVMSAERDQVVPLPPRD